MTAFQFIVKHKPVRKLWSVCPLTCTRFCDWCHPRQSQNETLIWLDPDASKETSNQHKPTIQIDTYSSFRYLIYRWPCRIQFVSHMFVTNWAHVHSQPVMTKHNGGHHKKGQDHLRFVEILRQTSTLSKFQHKPYHFVMDGNGCSHSPTAATNQRYCDWFGVQKMEQRCAQWNNKNWYRNTAVALIWKLMALFEAKVSLEPEYRYG